MTFADWLSEKRWQPFAFQESCWDGFSTGNDLLVDAPTGSGKTLAAIGCVLREPAPAGALRVVWVTPLRALAADLARSLAAPVEAIALGWTIETRTGDTSTSQKARQRKKLPEVLITTPESLSLLLSYQETQPLFSSVQMLVIDEWHELLGSKRGVQTELCLARIRRLAPGARTVGLSATVGNLRQALSVLVGAKRQSQAMLIRSGIAKAIAVRSVVPSDLGRFPWAGHLGLRCLPEVLAELDARGPSLLFTNTRNQAEHWFRALSEARPDWRMGLHHGSIDTKERRRIEDNVRTGELDCVVCTSSLDLGVDFPPVRQVLQVGSPKGAGRLIQRAGRSGHQPGETSSVICVPTSAFELVEFAAARLAVAAGEVESRLPRRLALDVLAQHAVTIALGGGFNAEELYEEVRTTYAFASLSPEQWRWILDFITTGGPALGAYAQYRRLALVDGRYEAASPAVARAHRLGIGTITSDSMVEVRYIRGGSLGRIEEAFIARLKPRERFVFAGKTLELVQLREMTAFVRKASGADAAVPRWAGGRMPLSTHLAGRVHDLLSTPDADEPELHAVRDILRLQERWSALPSPGVLLIESTKLRDGKRIYLYPFAGRAVHEGLGALIADRLARAAARTVTVAVNDYGIELLFTDEVRAEELDWPSLLSADGVAAEVLRALRETQLARRQFREIARIAGLVFQGHPGKAKTARQLQASSGLIFDVLSKYTPDHLLLEQARLEVLEQQFSLQELTACLERLSTLTPKIVECKRLTPLAFPLWAERMHAQVSSEKVLERIERMRHRLETQARRDGA